MDNKEYFLPLDEWCSEDEYEICWDPKEVFLEPMNEDSDK